MHDAGERLREQLDGAGSGRARLTLATWADLLPRYAELQLAAVPLAADLVAAGVPLVAPLDHPALFDELLGEDEWLRPGISPEMSFETYAQLCGTQALVAEAVDAVEAAGIGISIQHDDLHDGNVFVRTGDPRGFSIIDWGDSYLGHPFGTLLVTLNGIANRLGLDTATERPELARLVDAYLEPFTGPGRTLADLLRGVAVGAAARADRPGRVVAADVRGRPARRGGDGLGRLDAGLVRLCRRRPVDLTPVVLASRRHRKAIRDEPPSRARSRPRRRLRRAVRAADRPACA